MYGKLLSWSQHLKTVLETEICRDRRRSLNKVLRLGVHLFRYALVKTICTIRITLHSCSMGMFCFPDTSLQVTGSLLSQLLIKNVQLSRTFILFSDRSINASIRVLDQWGGRPGPVVFI